MRKIKNQKRRYPTPIPGSYRIVFVGFRALVGTRKTNRGSYSSKEGWRYFYPNCIVLLIVIGYRTFRSMLSLLVQTRRIPLRRMPLNRRTFSSTASSGSSLGQRMVSFSAGLGVGFGLSFYVIWEELSGSNARFGRQFEKLDERVKTLEGKK